jgi:protease-4
MAGLTDDDKISLVGVNSMANAARNTPKDKSGEIIAVYYAFGGIDGAASLTGLNEGIVSDKVTRDLRKLQEDDDIKAVVLRVNSPGGSAYGSEQIWRAVTELKSKKPVIVSMGDYAASGGYYISCNADSIVAEPTTLTGSIGIFGMMPNYGELSKKVGLSYDVVKTNRYADLFGDGSRKMTTDEAALMQNYINQGYELFVKRCAEGRGMTTDAIKKVAEGRVWTGASALQLGLVDELGGIDLALKMAAEKAGVESYTTAAYPAKKSFFELMMETAGEGGNYVRSLFLKGEAGKLFEQALWLQNLNEQDRVQARIPYDLNIN